MARKQSARDKIRQHFIQYMGMIVDTHDLAEIAGISDYQRRIRELRSEEGLNILSHHDRADLKPGQYILESLEPIPSQKRGISYTQRARILERDGFTCQLCGAGAGDEDPVNPGKKVRLHIDHIVPLSEGGSNDDSNLRVCCSACNSGRKNLHIPVGRKTINIMATIRQAPRDVQREIYAFLRKKFGDESDS